MKNDSIMTKVKACATQIGLKMPTDHMLLRVSRNSALHHHTMESKVVAPKAVELRWRRKFFEAVYLVQSLS